MKFLDKYLEDVKSRLIAAGIEITPFDEKKIRQYCESKLVDVPVVLHNNVKMVDYDTTALKLLDLVTTSPSKPIVTGFNTLFHNHNNAKNLPGDFLNYLLNERSVAKKKMFQHINDVDQAIHDSYYTLQLILKLLANSYYGSFAMKSFHFFNRLLGPSVTGQGRQLIISALLGFEGFLGNNVFFYEFDELVGFILNIHKESVDDELVLELETELTVDTVLERYMSLCKFDLTDIQKEYLQSIFENASETQLQKYYFKNNLMEFFEVEAIKDIVRESVVREDFPDVNKPPEDHKETLEGVSELLRYFVSYPYPIQNKSHTADTMIRKIVIISDTDSSFLNLHNWVRYVKRITNTPTFTKLQQVSVVTTMTYFVTKFIDEVFRIMTTHANVPEKEQPQINMKSEFHYSRVILTKNKKSYAGNILSKEGVVLNSVKFDVKGIPIKKVSTPKFARIFFSEVLENDMLNSPSIDLKTIFGKYHEFEQKVYDDIATCRSSFLKPGVIKTISSYAIPERMQSYRAMRVWNALHPHDYIPESSTFRILVLKSTFGRPFYIEPKKDKETDTFKEPTEREIAKATEEDELFWKTMHEVFDDEQVKRLAALYEAEPKLCRYGLDVVAIPMQMANYPSQLLPITDTELIVNSVISKGNILLEALGFTVRK